MSSSLWGRKNTQPPLRFRLCSGYDLLTSETPLSCAGGPHTDPEEAEERRPSPRSSWVMFPLTGLLRSLLRASSESQLLSWLWVWVARRTAESLCVHAGVLVFSKSVLQMPPVLYHKPTSSLPAVLHVFFWLQKRGFESELQLFNLLVGAEWRFFSFCHWPLLTPQSSCLRQRETTPWPHYMTWIWCWFIQWQPVVLQEKQSQANKPLSDRLQHTNKCLQYLVYFKVMDIKIHSRNIYYEQIVSILMTVLQPFVLVLRPMGKVLFEPQEVLAEVPQVATGWGITTLPYCQSCIQFS